MSRTVNYPITRQPSLAVSSNWDDLLPSDLWIAFQCLTGQSCITRLILPSDKFNSFCSKESCCLATIHQRVQHFKTTHESFFARLFGKYQLGFVHVTQWLELDSNASCECYPAYLSDFKYDWGLTKVVLKSHHRAMSAADATELNRLPVALQGGSYPPENARTLVVRRVIDMTKVIWFTGSLAVSAPLTGILLGVCSHNTEAAIALFAGVLALASFVQTLTSFFPV